MKEFICKHLDELNQVIEMVCQEGKHQTIWVLDGTMGAGKTSFVKSLADIEQWQDTVSSPTFSIVNEYRTRENKPIYHFDFYRIDNEFEALDIGVEEYFDSGHLCLIEWASRISGLLPEHFFYIHIEAQQDGSRIFRTQMK